METETVKTPETEITEDTDIDTGTLNRVVLFNDDEHTFEEVLLINKALLQF
jgi:hypothetical protein